MRFSEKRIWLVLCLFLWLYLWLRAALIPVTHDEAATFFYYIHRGEIFPFFSHLDTNNHFLNSALAWVSYRILGSSPLALRIPNLLFAPLFMLYCYKISTEIRQPLLRWTFILSLCFAHSFIEFFGLSRGFGISMALLFGAIWYLINLFKTKKLRYISLSLIFMMLATYSNLALINTYLIFIFLILAYAIVNEQAFSGKDRKVLGLLFFTGIIPFLFLGFILFRFKLNGNLWAPSANGIWNATVKTLIKLITASDAPVFGYFVAFYFIFSCLLFLMLLIREWKQKFFQSSQSIFFYLLTGNLLVIIFLGKIFKINYPEDRIGLYLFPMFIGCILFLLDPVKTGKKYPIHLLLVIPLFFLPVQFFMRLNLTYLSFYKSDNIPYRFYEKVYAGWIPGALPPTTGGYKDRQPCWSFQDFRKGGKLGDIYYSSYPGYEADFQLADLKDNPAWLKYYDSVDYDKVSGCHLLKRKFPLKKVFTSGSGTIFSGGEIVSQFFPLYETKVDSLTGKTLYLAYDMAIDCKVKPFAAWIVATINDSSGSILRYERIPLDWMRTEWKGPKNNFLNGLFLSDLPPGSDRLSTYIWNIEQVPFRINNGKCSVFSVIRDWE